MWTDNELFLSKPSPLGEKDYKCPCCGGPIDKPLGALGHPMFGAIQQAILNIVKDCGDEGISGPDLHDRVYGSQERDAKIIHVHICKMNKKLKPMGLQIKAVGGPGSTYRLLRLP